MPPALSHTSDSCVCFHRVGEVSSTLVGMATCDLVDANVANARQVGRQDIAHNNERLLASCLIGRVQHKKAGEGIC